MKLAEENVNFRLVHEVVCTNRGLRKIRFILDLIFLALLSILSICIYILLELKDSLQ